MWFITGWWWPFGKNSVLYSLGGNQAGMVVTNHPSHLYSYCMRNEFQSLSAWVKGPPVSSFIKNWIMAAWQHENTLDRDNPWPSPSLWRDAYSYIYIFIFKWKTSFLFSLRRKQPYWPNGFLFFHQWDGVLGLWSYKRDDHVDAKGEETKESLSKNTRCSARLTFKNPLRFWFKPTVFWF